MPPSPERAAAPAATAASSAAPQESGQLENLNEGELRALLDEAVSYKTPKDLDGMSKLFKNLLHKAEQDEYLHGQTGSGGCSGGFNGGKRGRAKRGLAAFPHSGSLQDLAGVGAGPDSRAPRPQARHRRPVPVSQRSFHGGSLPANVDQQNFGVCENRHSFLEEVQYGKGDGVRAAGGGGDYIATVRCVNPPPLGRDPSDYAASGRGERAPSPSTGSVPRSAYDAVYFDDDGTEMELISSKKISHAASYTTRATLEIGSPGSAGESAVDRSVAFNLVDSNHGCISSPGISQPSFASLENKPLQLPSSYNAVRSVTEGSGSPNGAAAAAFSSITNSPMNIISLISQPSHQSFDSDKAKKHLDENYNSVQSVGSVANSGQHAKKAKRKKFFKNETETLAEQVDGYRGDEEDIDKILKFIESDVETVKHHGKYQSKSHSDVGINGKVANREKGKDDNDNEKAGKKRSTERRIKDGKLDSKMKRANSMEEISHRKFDDLTNNSNKGSLRIRKSKKSAGTDGSDSSEGKASERRSWCNEEIEQYFNAEDNSNEGIVNANHVSDVSSPNTKKIKQIQNEIDLTGCDPFYNIETSDFQTVTKKKKLRKRHSPCDENRNHSHHGYNHHMHTGKIPVGIRATQERNVIYKRYGNSSRPSASSPPSDKSNDSNDDLDSVHSLPADASGERLQASYADMARAAPSSSPPPPVQSSIVRQHNFPDLIESCNYYSNEVSIQEKHPDVSVENTKNLLLKNNQLYDTDMSNQTEHKAYVREQYPALESRHKIDRNMVKTKIDNRYHGNYKNVSERSDKKSGSKLASKCSKDEIYCDNSSISLSNEGNSVENYVAFAKMNNSINSAPCNESYQNPKMNKFSYTSLKVENSSKPPDVVLPITEMAHLMNDELGRLSDNYTNRPPVIIMNEEVNITSHNTQNINGITFGFDINEQLINGDVQSSSDGSISTEYTSIDGNDTKSCEITTKEHIIYNSNIDFPAINEKPYREYHEKHRNNDDMRHSKKSNRLLNKEGSKNNNKNYIVATTLQDSSYFKQNDVNDNLKEDVSVEGGAVVETYVGRDKALRYLAPTTTSKHICNLDKIVHYVGMAWEDIIKSPGGKVRYFSEQQ